MDVCIGGILVPVVEIWEIEVTGWWPWEFLEIEYLRNSRWKGLRFSGLQDELMI